MIRCLEIPESHDDRITWLQREVMGTELPELVTELIAIGDVTDPPSEEAVTLVSDERILKQGLAWMEPEQIQVLLRNPVVLQTVQQTVLEEDPDYWSAIVAPPDDAGRAAVSQTRDTLGNLLADDESPVAAPAQATVTPSSNSWYTPAAWATCRAWRRVA